MILDADLTVPPEDLPRFYEAWRSGKAEFVNGVRLVYPMEDRAMRFFNHVRYGERTYGETNFHRWSHGMLLLRMVAKGMRKIKFV
jgi:hypothetical protein